VLITLAGCSSGNHASSAVDATAAHDVAPGCSSGTIAGTITTDSVTHTFGPVVRAYVAYDSQQKPALVIDEQPGTCGTVQHTGFNLALVFGGLPAAGMYASNAGVLGVADQDGIADLALSVGGSVTVDRADASCISGSYSLQFGSHAMPDQGSLTGSFAVEVCP